MLEPQKATTEEKWLDNIQKSAEKYLTNKHGLGVSGPVLVITESILKAKMVLEHLQETGYPIMTQDKDGEWTPELRGSGVGSCAHVFPYFQGHHCVMEKLPDASIVVASNKGGRGLDLKLDGSCPKGCSFHHPHLPRTEGGSVLFVILTEVLTERQDVQARGRCGRSGKAGVIQYQLLQELEPHGSGKAIVEVVRVQNKKVKEESGRLLSKAERVAEMVQDCQAKMLS